MFGKENETLLLLLGLVAVVALVVCGGGVGGGGEGEISVVGFVDGTVIFVTCDIVFVVSLGIVVCGNESVLLFGSGFGG